MGSNTEDDSDFLADEDELAGADSSDDDGDDDGTADDPGGGASTDGDDENGESSSGEAETAGTSDYIAIADLPSGPHVTTRMGVKAARAKERLVICPGQEGYTKVIRDTPAKDGVNAHSPTFSYVLAAPAHAPAAKERVFVVAKAPGKGRQPPPTMKDVREQGHFVLLAISATCDMRRFRTLCAEEYIRVGKDDIAAITAASDPATPAAELDAFKAKHPDIARAIPFPYLSYVSVTAANATTDKATPTGGGTVQSSDATAAKKRPKPVKPTTTLSDTTTVVLSSAGAGALMAAGTTGSPATKPKHKPGKSKPTESSKPGKLKPTESPKPKSKPKPVETPKNADPPAAKPVDKPKQVKPKTSKPASKPTNVKPAPPSVADPTPVPTAKDPAELTYTLTVTGPLPRLKRLFSAMESE